jgi:hypothetical protein
MPTYQAYVAQCNAHGLRPLSYVAWLHLQPLVEAQF